MFDDTYTPKIFQVRELNNSPFSPAQFVKATGRAYILDNVQSLIQTSRPLTIDHNRNLTRDECELINFWIWKFKCIRIVENKP